MWRIPWISFFSWIIYSRSFLQHWFQNKKMSLAIELILCWHRRHSKLRKTARTATILWSTSLSLQTVCINWDIVDLGSFKVFFSKLMWLDSVKQSLLMVSVKLGTCWLYSHASRQSCRFSARKRKFPENLANRSHAFQLPSKPGRRQCNSNSLGIIFAGIGISLNFTGIGILGQFIKRFYLPGVSRYQRASSQSSVIRHRTVIRRELFWTLTIIRSTPPLALNDTLDFQRQ